MGSRRKTAGPALRRQCRYSLTLLRGLKVCGPHCNRRPGCRRPRGVPGAALAVRLPGLVLPRRGRSRCPAAAAPPVARPARRSGRPAPRRVAGGRCGPAPCRPSRRLRRAAAGRGRPAVAVSSRRPFGAAGHPPPGGPPWPPGAGWAAGQPVGPPRVLLVLRSGAGSGPHCGPGPPSSGRPGAAARAPP